MRSYRGWAVTLVGMMGAAFLVANPGRAPQEEPEPSPLELILVSDQLNQGMLPEEEVLAIIINRGEQPVKLYRYFDSMTVGIDLIGPQGEELEGGALIYPGSPRSKKEAEADIITLNPGEAFGCVQQIKYYVEEFLKDIPPPQRTGEWKFRMYFALWYPRRTETGREIKYPYAIRTGRVYSPFYTVRLPQGEATKDD